MVKYLPLNPQEVEIRLLRLLPGKDDEGINCTLQTVSLNDPLKFEALSYVWGDLSITTPINVEGESFPVTANLSAALRALRQRHISRTLWIDAICINQDDLLEKNVQVPLMSRLYSSASGVVVWLGESNPNIELAVSWAETYTSKMPNRRSAYWLKLDSRAVFSRTARREKDMAVLRAYEGSFDLFNLPYWQRMWTFQEYRLPEREPKCVCGELTFGATSLWGKALDPLSEAGTAILEQFSSSLTDADYEQMGNEERAHLEEMSQIVQRLKGKNDILPGNMPTHPRTWRDPLQSQESLLVYLMMITAGRKCYDPRDKIYALYGMVPALLEAHPPDYAKPVPRIILETMAFAVNRQNGTVIYLAFGLRRERFADASYPSWVPDMGQEDPDSPTKHDLGNHYRLAGLLSQWDEASADRVSDDLTTLHLWARTLGPSKVVRRFGSDASANVAKIYELIKTDISALPPGSAGRSIRDPESLGRRIARACVAHHARSHECTGDELLAAFDIMGKKAKTGETVTRRNEPKDQLVWQTILRSARKLPGKVLFVTESGCLGVGVSAVEDGDIVVVPPQVKQPLLLRQDPSDTPKSKNYYRMVGTAYVDGVMTGECLDPPFVETVAKTQLSEYLVR